MKGAYATWTGSIARILLLSVAFGHLSLLMLVGITGLPGIYANEGATSWIVAPAGFFCGMILAVCVHEFAHALAVRAVGGHLYGIEIGSGRLLVQFPVLGTKCRVHASLISGAVWYGLTSPLNLRRKFAFITASAPVATVALCVLCLGLLAWLVQSRADLPAKLVAFATGLTGSTFFYLPGTLLPFHFNYHGQRLKTDALKLLTIPWMTDVEIANHVRLNLELVETREWMDTGLSSLEAALARVEVAPDDPKALFTAAQWLRDARDARALAFSRALLKLPAKSDAARALFLDLYLTVCLDLNHIAGNDEADRYSKELLALKPDDLSTRGTRGSVLVDLGHLAEGDEVLREVLARSTRNSDKAYAYIFRALVFSAGAISSWPALLPKKQPRLTPSVRRWAELAICFPKASDGHRPPLQLPKKTSGSGRRLTLQEMNDLGARG